MSKLPDAHRFIDLSDYGRPVARVIAKVLKNTSITPIHVTWSFIACGILGILFLTKDIFWLSAIMFVFKSILDAADGELARVKNTPSYTGRYFDSIADILLNLMIIYTLMYITDSSFVLSLLAFIGIQLQGTLYNYYYVIIRNKVNGDTTSRIFEDSVPTALKGETQKAVNTLYYVYRFLYKFFDAVIFHLDKSASRSASFPNWFMTLVSTMGLGFQLLVISSMLVLGLIHYIIPFFVAFTLFIPIFILIRKTL